MKVKSVIIGEKFRRATMRDHDPYDKDFGFDEVAEPEEFWIDRPSKRKFTLRNHWLVWLLAINSLSFTVMLFLYSGGHPIAYIKKFAGHLWADYRQDSPEVLLREDAERIQRAVEFARGKGVKYGVYLYSADAMWEPYYENARIMNSVGNSFIEVPSGYYYLSLDRKRLYKCFLEEKKKVLPSPAPSPPLRLRVSEEIYRDKKGVWRNRFVSGSVETEEKSEAGNSLVTRPKRKKKDFGKIPFKNCITETNMDSVEGKRRMKDFSRVRDLMVKYAPDGAKNCKSRVCEVQGKSDIAYLEGLYRNVIRAKKEFLEPYGDGYIFLSRNHHFYFLSKMICLTEDEARQEHEELQKFLNARIAEESAKDY